MGDMAGHFKAQGKTSSCTKHVNKPPASKYASPSGWRGGLRLGFGDFTRRKLHAKCNGADIQTHSIFSTSRIFINSLRRHSISAINQFGSVDLRRVPQEQTKPGTVRGKLPEHRRSSNERTRLRPDQTLRISDGISVPWFTSVAHRRMKNTERATPHDYYGLAGLSYAG